MKNKRSILLLILSLITVGIFAVAASGVKIDFIENYGTNFRRNVKGLEEMFSWKFPEPIENFLNQTPRPLTTEEKLAILEKQQAEESGETEAPQESSLPTATPQTAGTVTSNIVAQKNAYTAGYAAYEGKVLCAAETALSCYRKDGSLEWSKEIQANQPILKTAKNYILVAERGGTHFYMFSGKKMLYEQTTDAPIVSASVSEHGDTVLIAEKDHYRGTVTVYNKKSKEVFRWNSGSYAILDADISPSSRTLAVSLLETENSVNTKISFFHLTEAESYASVSFEDTILFDIKFAGEQLTAVGDNQIMSLNTKGETNWQTSFDGKTLNRYILETDGHKLCVLDQDNAAKLLVLNNRGGERTTLSAKTLPDFVDLSSGYLAYNDGREIIYTSFSGKDVKRYLCSRDLKGILLIAPDELMAVYSSGLEFIRF